MNQDTAPGPARKPRADGERNRQRLLDTAKRVFAQKGSAASLDAIARAAGVGIGTLYRHFPTRDALIAGVYGNELDQLAESAARFAETQAPVEALRGWLLQFVDYLAAKQGMAEVLNSVSGGMPALYANAGADLRGVIDRLVARAVESGEIRLDMKPFDLLRAITGVANIASEPGWEPSARRLVDILLAGCRVQP